MAFASTSEAQSVFGDKRLVFGQFTQVSGDTGGDIVTGLSSVDYFDAYLATAVSVSEGTATITTADPVANQTGYWMALGAL